MPTAIEPAAMNAGAVSIVTPPVGISGISGNGPRISRTKPGPTTEAGKSFTADAPERHARRTSVGVDAPGNAGMPRSSAASMMAGVRVRHHDEPGTGIDGRRRRVDRQDGPSPDEELVRIEPSG